MKSKTKLLIGLFRQHNARRWDNRHNMAVNIKHRYRQHGIWSVLSYLVN